LAVRRQELVLANLDRLAGSIGRWTDVAHAVAAEGDLAGALGLGHEDRACRP